MTPVILSRQQLDQLWEIDRSEIIDTLYRLDNGQLRAYREYYGVRGWDPHDRQVYTPIHEACYDRGGIFFAFFDDEQMIAAAALDTLPRGMNGELRQLLFFYVGAGKRGQGWGRRLFQYALHQLPEMGASGLYISSIPNKNTVDFYLAQGCRLADKPDPALFALEPEDIHLVCHRL
ncbi:TPA: GNAT family N-acetyltransferase [Klebsiella pneumoniae]|uniref:GNAT family N-acetyltransferase n=1 Tax=Klebsiella pneumoniae TaxID=573 RepID=UPI001C7DF149|nr:GNAT family N-acetyltransferase [Klebsiella pneumoniae]MCA5533203.1 GNAT family N-acetyltransferase [Klebsiella pneumoniae]MCQ8280907.1 GNAT family N-acetyltransferase [Klebsiella pneumoniae]MEB2423968.1 GNAT family N-acetyltransferase [Klebsiella pneumoniae]HBY3988322.1 GNAT family N-acetyltransferase [Klebsiella pneumoniae]HDZ9449318.1 GNAT family N-acetyltransferase [Klebsiella pneumoniae]